MDVAGADFTGVDFTGVDFEAAGFGAADFEAAGFGGADFAGLAGEGVGRLRGGRSTMPSPISVSASPFRWTVRVVGWRGSSRSTRETLPRWPALTRRVRAEVVPVRKTVVALSATQPRWSTPR
ncbi:pentapeptide repeat-containing protein [Streptomyces sp. NPDC049555]|uniref:pentapeptide repeat-containing protein n=1 Tax=Streptomyces sp. NPDC049555 TaxID=3154930 RepID=UPI00343A706D